MGPAIALLRRSTLCCVWRWPLVATERSRPRIVDAWRREDEATGALIHRVRTATMLATLPPRSGSSAALLWSRDGGARDVWSSGVPRDQSYPIRWEFGAASKTSAGREGRARDRVRRGPFPRDGRGAGPPRRRHRLQRHGGCESAGARAARILRRVRRARETRRPLPRASTAWRFSGHRTSGRSGQLSSRRWPNGLRPDARLLISCPGPASFHEAHSRTAGRRERFLGLSASPRPALDAPCASRCRERHGWEIEEAMEEPFSWVAAGSHIGIARAIHHGRLDRPLGRA